MTTSANIKRDTALFWVSELRYDGAKRKEIVSALVEEMGITIANASYYTDRCFKDLVIPVAMKTVTNMMTGKEVRIARDTPRSCDVSSELYWSM